jgi:hypothetical protein
MYALICDCVCIYLCVFLYFLNWWYVFEQPRCWLWVCYLQEESSTLNSGTHVCMHVCDIPVYMRPPARNFDVEFRYACMYACMYVCAYARAYMHRRHICHIFASICVFGYACMRVCIYHLKVKPWERPFHTNAYSRSQFWFRKPNNRNNCFYVQLWIHSHTYICRESTLRFESKTTGAAVCRIEDIDSLFELAIPVYECVRVSVSACSRVYNLNYLY